SRAVEVLRGAPGARDPAMVEQDLPSEREGAVADDAGLGREWLPADDRGRSLLQRLMRHDRAGHPLPANLLQQGGSFVTVNTGFDQPRGTHPRFSSLPTI